MLLNRWVLGVGNWLLSGYWILYCVGYCATSMTAVAAARWHRCRTRSVVRDVSAILRKMYENDDPSHMTGFRVVYPLVHFRLALGGIDA